MGDRPHLRRMIESTLSIFSGGLEFLAENGGITRSDLQRWAREPEEPGTEEIERLAEAVDRRADDLRSLGRGLRAALRERAE